MQSEDRQTVWDLLMTARVPEVASGFDRPLSSADFLPYTTACEGHLKRVIEAFEEKGTRYATEAENNRFISEVVLLAGEHSTKSLWTTDNSLALAGKLLGLILSKENYPSLSLLLTCNNQKIFKIALDVLRPFLLQKTWKKFPAAILCFSWILKHVKSPHLGVHLNKVLPTALIITDDFESHNRLLGLNCIYHIIDNVTKTEMTMCNFHDVIIEALRPVLYHNEPDVISPMVKTYVVLMNKLLPQHPVADLTRNNFDDIFEVILKNMYLEQNIHVRTVYIECLPLLIKAKGLATLRHGNLIYKILEEYILETTSTNLALEALMEVLKVSWPRKRWVFDSTMRILLKLIYNYTKNRSELSTDVITKLKIILSTVTHLCPDDAKSLINDVKKYDTINDFHSVLVSFFPHELTEQ